MSTSPEATPEGTPTVTVATALLESNNAPAFTNVIADVGVAVAVGVAVVVCTGVGGGGVGRGRGRGWNYRRERRRRRQGPGWNQQDRLPADHRAPIGVPLAGNLELAL